MDRAFDPRPVPHHRLPVLDVFSSSLAALRLAHRVGPVDDAAKLLNLVLDGPYELVDGEVTQDTPNMRVRKPVRLTVLLFELDEEQRPKARLQATILNRHQLHTGPRRLSVPLAVEDNVHPRREERRAH